MSSSHLFRLSGLSAILAGLLRGANSFLSDTASEPVLEILYLLTDIFILFGLMGLYGIQYQESGKWGFFGFVMAIAGIAVIRTRAIAGIDLYPIGALIFVIGLSALAIGTLIAKKLPKWVPVLWLISAIAGILSGILSFTLLFILSGILFGIGFTGAGITLWSTEIS